jgi:E3 ubiquitin-protein ligase BRE1
VEAQKKKHEDVTKEIAELKVKFEELKVKSQVSKPIEVQLDEPHQEFHDAYYCQLCKERFRDTFMIECRHSYYENCLKECVRNRNRKCPYCSVLFDPFYGIIAIKW